MPNGADKKLNFVAKVWDEVAQAYRPIYIAPDATDTVQGDVKLSDAVDSTLDAANGMTAATPKAVKSVQDNANNKLDKVAGADQTVASKVTFQNEQTFSKGATIPSGYYLTGDVEGNASTATTLETSRSISVKSGNATAGSANFNGSADITINVPQLDATTLTGMVPIASIPQGALERLVKVANQTARFALTTGDVQLGDSVLQTDTGVMYIVVDTNELDNAAGYQEYKASTAMSVPWTGVQGKPASYPPAAHQHPFTDITGTIAQSQIADGSIGAGKVGFNYAGSANQGGAATSAVKLSTARTISLTGFVTGSTSFDGSGNVSINTSIVGGGIGTDNIEDDAITSDKLSNNSVTTQHIVNGTILDEDIANATITGTKLANQTIPGSKLANQAVGTSQIANSAVTNAKIANGAVNGNKIANDSVTLNHLAADIGTVYVGDIEPTDSNVLIWVNPSAAIE